MFGRMSGRCRTEVPATQRICDVFFREKHLRHFAQMQSAMFPRRPLSERGMNQNSKKLNRLQHLLKQWWVPSGFLYILKSHQVKAKGDRLPVRVYVGYSEIFSRKVSEARLRKQIKKFNFLDCLVAFAQMGMTLENEGATNPKVQNALMERLFSQNLVQRILNIKPKHQDVCLVFTEQQILTLIKLALLCGSSGKKPLIGNSQKAQNRFVDSLLVVNDHLENDFHERMRAASAEEEREEAKIEFFVRNSFLNSHQAFRNLLPRYYHLFLEIPQESNLVSSTNNIDLDQTFKEATSFDLKTFLFLGFHLCVQLRDQSLIQKNYTPSGLVLGAGSHFSKTSIKNREAKKVLDYLAITRKDFRKEWQQEVRRTRNFYYSFLTMRRTPLFRMKEDKYIPMSLRFLKERITVGVYWIIFDHLKEKKGDKVALGFKQFFGEIFQRYVEQMFSRIISQSNSLADRLFFDIFYETSDGQRRSSDAVLFYPRKAVFLEVKTGTLQMAKTAIPGTIQEFEKDLDKIVTKSATQLEGRINDFKRGQLSFKGYAAREIDTFYPVVVTLDSIPQEHLIWRRIERRLAEEGCFQSEDIARLHIIDIEEMEMLEPLIQSGKSLVEVLEQKSSDSMYADLSMKNFLYYKYGQDSELLHNRFLRDENTRIITEISKLLFAP